MESDTETKNKGTGIRSSAPVKTFDLLLRLIRRQKAARQTPEFDPTRPPDQMSGLTLRILAVNIIAIMILGLGILYLGQYTDSLIEGELAGLRSEAQLFSGAISEGAVRPVYQISPVPFTSPQDTSPFSSMLKTSFSPTKTE
jgi:hypothetical protein